ncbi:MAG TPA: hypothetical protein VK502_01260 [Candidatus Saccharimonadales bacterium]|nr:hypothetical protein [Candidatus Saccharimonadales bacterium]
MQVSASIKKIARDLYPRRKRKATIITKIKPGKSKRPAKDSTG